MTDSHLKDRAVTPIDPFLTSAAHSFHIAKEERESKQEAEETPNSEQ